MLNTLVEILMIIGGSFFFLAVILYQPIVYFFLVRPLDKKYPFKQYGLEKGLPYGSFIWRLTGYSLDIFFQSKRGKHLKSKLLKRMRNGRQAYRKNLYGKNIDIRKGLSRFQLCLAYIHWPTMLSILITTLMYYLDKAINPGIQLLE